jgi:hypothetical protein
MPFISATNVVDAFEEKTIEETVDVVEPLGIPGDWGGAKTRTITTEVRERQDFPVNPDFQLQIGETKEGRMIYVMREDFYYCHEKSARVFRVRRHFETDLTSVPKPLWPIVNPSGKYLPAAIIHDWLYAIGRPGGREDADDVMIDAMIDLGVSKLKRAEIEFAIRNFGGKGYGLESDWAFSDPALNGKRYRDIPRELPPKPATAVCFNGPCGSFVPPKTPEKSPYE